MAEDTQAEAEHRAKMARIKAAKDRLYATKTGEKGLLIVHTGTGKGKSTAAWGLAMRCLGHGLKLGVVQFVKGRSVPGERLFLERFPELVTIKVMGHGFTWETQDRAQDIAAARAAFERGQGHAAGPGAAPGDPGRAQHRPALRHPAAGRGARRAGRQAARTCTSSSPAATPSPS